MKLSLIVPLYNEGENIRDVILGLKTTLDSNIGEKYEIVAVDNGSTDNTSEILRSLSASVPQLQVVYIFPNKGYGGGILAGLSRASGEILGWIDGDSQSEPISVVKIYRKLIEERLDFCRGVRILRQDGFFRKIQSAVYNGLFRIIFCTSCRDINAKPKIFKREFYEKANFSSHDWFIDAEVIIKAKTLGVKTGELKVHTLQRQHGVSQVRPVAILEFLKNMVYYKLRK